MHKCLHTKFPCKASWLMLLVVALFTQVCLHAAKTSSKEKKGYVLRFKGFEVKNSFQSHFTLQPGINYHGSFNQVQVTPQQATIQSIITYQRGNATFIYPYQHKVSVPKFKTPEAQRN